jgi:putative ATP-dependent endonuclease of OLD family
MKDAAVLGRHVKSFGNEPTGWRIIKPVNIAIGRNNAGKSTMLDIVQYACNEGTLIGHGNHSPQVFVHCILGAHHFAEVPPSMRDRTNQMLGQRYILDRDVGHWRTPEMISKNQRIEHALSGMIGDPFRSKTFFRLGADRDIVAETNSLWSEGGSPLRENGQFATALIQSYYLDRRKRELVEVRMLDALKQERATFHCQRPAVD